MPRPADGVAVLSSTESTSDTCRPFLALADPHPQGCPWTDGIMAGLIESVGMQKCITRAIGQRHEAEPLFRVEPLDSRVVLGAEARRGGPRWCGPRQFTWRSTIEAEVVIEAAAPAWASAAAVGHVQEKIVPIYHTRC